MKKLETIVLKSTDKRRIGVQETLSVKTKPSGPGGDGGPKNPGPPRKPRITMTMLAEMIAEQGKDIKKIYSILKKNNLK